MDASARRRWGRVAAWCGAIAMALLVLLVVGWFKVLHDIRAWMERGARKLSPVPQEFRYLGIGWRQQGTHPPGFYFYAPGVPVPGWTHPIILRWTFVPFGGVAYYPTDIPEAVLRERGSFD